MMDDTTPTSPAAVPVSRITVAGPEIVIIDAPSFFVLAQPDVRNPNVVRVHFAVPGGDHMIGLVAAAIGNLRKQYGEVAVRNAIASSAGFEHSTNEMPGKTPADPFAGPIGGGRLG